MSAVVTTSVSRATIGVQRGYQSVLYSHREVYHLWIQKYDSVIKHTSSCSVSCLYQYSKGGLINFRPKFGTVGLNYRDQNSNDRPQ